MKLAEILTGPETWIQNGYGRGARYCLQAAVVVLENRRDPGHSLARLMSVLGTSAIVEWNDATERTWEDVAAVVEAYDRDRLLNP